MVLVGFLIFIAVGSATISSNDKNKARLAAARKLSEQADTARTDLITTMSGGQILQQVEAESSLLTLSKGPAPLNLEIYKPGSVQAAVIVLSAARGDAKLLDSLFNFWAQRGYLVAVVQMARNPVQAPADASLVRSTMKHLSDGGTLSKEAAGRIALVSVAMDLDETMLAAKELGQDSNNGSGELSGVILINPVAGGQPAAVAADYHACQFPVCYILDADVKPAARQSAMRRCLTAFSFGSGRQLFFNSLRISLTAKPSYNQTVLHSLLSGFLSAGLGQDHAKESYLYSQKSVTAVSSVADLRFR